MRIAQVAPLWEAVPPVGYGGTERVVSYLTEELVRRGHDVTVLEGDTVLAAFEVPVRRVAPAQQPQSDSAATAAPADSAAKPATP